MNGFALDVDQTRSQARHEMESGPIVDAWRCFTASHGRTAGLCNTGTVMTRNTGSEPLLEGVTPDGARTCTLRTSL